MATQVPQHVRLKTVARRLDIHPKTLQRWVREGKFPKPIEIGGVQLFNEADVLIFLREKGRAELSGTIEDKPEHLGTSGRKRAKRD